MDCPNCNREVPGAAEECPFCGVEIKEKKEIQTPRVFITSEDTAEFSCPNCNRFRSMDVSKYKKIEKAVRLKYKCNHCEHSYSVILERRQGGHRKETELFGDYMCIRAGKSVHTGRIVVKDVSLTGVRFQLTHADADAIKASMAASTDVAMEKKNSKGCALKVGSQVMTEFRLSDKKRTLIKHQAVVRWISDRFVGVQFAAQKPHPALKLWMWN
jgi:hypothetical protein